MRKVIIAGNWKMNNDVSGAVALVQEIKNKYKNQKNVIVLICPPFTDLSAVSQEIKGTAIKLGAQNFHPAESGAFTGEISAEMLKSVGCEYVIIGHSERRQYFMESNEFLNQKVRTALTKALTPIYCVGETLEQRESNETFNIIQAQLVEGLKGFSAEEFKKIVIAYEPVWAIGTGKTASPAQAEEVHKFIRGVLAQLSNKQVAEEVSILYGGSVNADNISELMATGNIDGGLVGGASLKAEGFLGIVNY